PRLRRTALGALRRHGGAEPFVRQIRSLRTSDTASIAAQLPTLGIPARVVWGVADPFQKIEYGERFAHALDAPLTRIEGAKHRARRPPRTGGGRHQRARGNGRWRNGGMTAHRPAVVVFDVVETLFSLARSETPSPPSVPTSTCTSPSCFATRSPSPPPATTARSPTSRAGGHGRGSRRR
ncbi:MAG: hypothetical protein M3P34_04970, partial [Actinomycetota bacterium]|nr:hypothetical protein [Actinomycetota bacterium]